METNKYQEAFERLVSNDYEPSFADLMNCVEEDMSALQENDEELIKELVDKATPKKPLIGNGEWEEYLHEYYDSSFVCPNCGKFAIYDSEYDRRLKHCHECAQSIDWQGIDEDRRNGVVVTKNHFFKENEENA